MTDEELEQLRYPIGRYHKPKDFDAQERAAWIQDIREFPSLIRGEVEGLEDADLQKQYRPKGWNIRQLVHHCADSHLNSQGRYRLALTEDHPTIRPYLEARWAELGDASSAPLQSSLILLEGLHMRWSQLLDSMSDADFEKTYYHPESKVDYNLHQTTALYSWHGRHHLEHIRIAKRS